MSEQNRAIVTRFFAEVCNGRNMDIVDEIFAASHAYHDTSNPQIGPGPQGVRDMLGVYHQGFSNSHWKVDAMYAVDDTVITRWTGRGTQDGPLPGLPATGRQVEVPGVWILRIQNGRIVESWNVWDTLGMLRQLGAVPAATASAAGQ